MLRKKTVKQSRPQRPGASSSPRNSLPGLRLHYSRDRTAAVLLQQSVRRLSKCGGLGVEQHIDPDLVIPDKDRTLRGGAISPWAKSSSSPYYVQTLQALGKHWTGSPSKPSGRTCPRQMQDAILNGSGERAIRFVYDDGIRAYETKKPFEGVMTDLERR